MTCGQRHAIPGARKALVTAPINLLPHKTFVVFALAGPGQLIKALGVFAICNLALYKVRRCNFRLRMVHVCAFVL